MKKLLLFLIMIVVVAAVFYLPGMINSGSGGQEAARKNPTYAKIDDDISILKDRSPQWSLETKTGYDSILKYIQAAETHELIDQELALKLEKYLDAVYIPMVVRAAEDFFANNCNPSRFLSVINAELKNYSDYSRNKDHKALADEMRSYTSGVYYVRGWVQNGVRRGLDQDVSDYIQRGRLDVAKSKEMLNELDQYQNLKYLNQCDIVNNSINRNREQLSDFHFASLKDKVDRYTSDINNYQQTESDDLKKLLSDYETINYLRSITRMKAKTQPLRRKLNIMQGEYRKANSL